MDKSVDQLKSEYLAKLDEWRIAFSKANQLDHQASVLRRYIIKHTRTKRMDGKIFITYGDDKFELTQIGVDEDYPLYSIMKNKRMVRKSYWGHCDDVKFDIVMGKL